MDFPVVHVFRSLEIYNSCLESLNHLETLVVLGKSLIDFCTGNCRWGQALFCLKWYCQKPCPRTRTREATSSSMDNDIL